MSRDRPTPPRSGPALPAAAVHAAAEDLGFDAVGVARLAELDRHPEGRRYLDWLAAGRHGGMGYLERGARRRLHPGEVLAGARSIVVAGLNHGPREDGAAGSATGPGDPAGAVPDGSADDSAPTGVVARYARGRDYHKVFPRRLRALEERITDLLPGTATRRYVDTGPVLEKLWAERAGLGWRGKHTNLVSPEFGSWLLLGVVLVAADLEPDEPHDDRCGTCRACLDACPTDAFPAPYRLDATRCVSYLTIEHRGSIARELRAGIGDRVFGCDDCLAACPWNRYARAAAEADFRPRPETVAPLLAELVALDEDGFRERFAGTPVMRAKREGLARNACVALGNSGRADAVPSLVRALAGDPSPVVREHAAWALGRLGGPAAEAALREAVADPDPAVRDEAARAVKP